MSFGMCQRGKRDFDSMGRRDTLLLSILTLITAIGWIMFDVYHAAIENTVPQNVEAQLAPITPTFKRAVIEDLKGRSVIDPLVTQESIAPTPQVVNTQIPTPQAGVNTATSSGQTQSSQ